MSGTGGETSGGRIYLLTFEGGVFRDGEGVLYEVDVTYGEKQCHFTGIANSTAISAAPSWTTASGYQFNVRCTEGTYRHSGSTTAMIRGDGHLIMVGNASMRLPSGRTVRCNYGSTECPPFDDPRCTPEARDASVANCTANATPICTRMGQAACTESLASACSEGDLFSCPGIGHPEFERCVASYTSTCVENNASSCEQSVSDLCSAISDSRCIGAISGSSGVFDITAARCSDYLRACGITDTRSCLSE